MGGASEVSRGAMGGALEASRGAMGGVSIHKSYVCTQTL